MEIKNLPFEVKADVEKRMISGYASTWKKDLVGDQIVQGAFKKTLAERFPLGKIKVLWQHGAPLGMPTVMKEDSTGLYVEAKISKTTLGNDALEYMRDGVVDEMSIGYDVLLDDLSEDGQTRYLKELQLYEFSPVTFGANPYTSINGVKTLEMATLLKEGRSISGANIERIRTAVNHLTDLLEAAEKESEKSRRPANATLKTPVYATDDELKAFFDLAAEIKNYKK